jgi:hypothetical protein
MNMRKIMRFRIRRGLLFLGGLSLCLLGPTSYSRSAEAQSDKDEQDYKQDENGIAHARQSGGLAKFQALGDDIDRKWRGKNKQKHAELMLKLCEPITSGEFRGDRGDDLARRYALSGLRDPNAISVSVPIPDTHTVAVSVAVTEPISDPDAVPVT